MLTNVCVAMSVVAAFIKIGLHDFVRFKLLLIIYGIYLSTILKVWSYIQYEI